MMTFEKMSPSAAPHTFALPEPTFLQRAFYRLPLWGYRLGFGGLFEALKIAVLTTRGRRSGQPRFTALEFRQHGSKLYIISGWGAQANWVRNLQGDPQVTLRRGLRAQAARAEVVTDRSEVFRALTLYERSNSATAEWLFKRISQRDSLDGLTLPQVADRVLVVRVLPESGAPVLPPAPAADPKIAAGLSAGVLLLLLTGLLAFALGRARRSD
jgi:deazaflavin-dependent oxidoreductase (nitroreductase family)